MCNPESNKEGKPKKALPVLNNLTQPSGFGRFGPVVLAPLQPKERQDAIQNRERVLEAARQLFNQRGVENVTMTEIADEAGVGVGTIYRRFPDKGALCHALMESNTIAFQQEVLAGFGEAGRQANPALRLRLFLNRLLDFTEENAPLLNAIFEVETGKFGVSLYARPAYDWLRMTTVILLKEAIAAGECRPDLDSDYMAYALLSPLQIGLYLFLRQQRAFEVARIKSGLEQLLDGIFVAQPT